MNYPGASHDIPELLQDHLDQLTKGSGLSPDIVRERGYRSITRKDELEQLGFSIAQRRVPGLLLPLHAPDGTQPFSVYRPDNPRKDTRGRSSKYEIPSGTGTRLDVPPRCRPMLADPKIPLWVTEGQKKGDALAQHELCAVALLGVWMFKGTNDQNGVTFLADWDYIALNGRTVYIIFDSDVMTKSEVGAALKRLTEHLRRKGASVIPVYLPPTPDGAKQGVDDFLLTHTVEQLKELASAQPAMRQPAAPALELLDEPPAILTKPMQLVGGHSYVSTWLHVKRTTTESRAKGGSIVIHNPPLVEVRRELFVIRDDGVIFGTGGEPLENLDFEVRLGDPPPADRLWSTMGVKRYRAGQRPDVADVFHRVASVFDHYLDFARSIGTQEQMCRLSACLTIATYLTDAFTVMGYPWPNGEKGCGKTKWASLWAGMGYLGMLVTAGGSFAALRDLAEYGAALAFDDAENLNDPKRVDPDKRALLLAGNRKGTQIPLKEQVGDKWATRWVNAYAPRAFTAINAPDDVLHSRSIVIPLVRTGDAARANRDPAKTHRWPCDFRQLIDDLWALGLWLLPEAAKTWDELDEELGTVGRELEPWRASLATARLIERHGVPSLEADVREVMQNYFEERGDSVAGDRQRATALAVVRYVEGQVRDNKDNKDNKDVFTGEVAFLASDIVNTLKALASGDEEMEDDCSWATAKAVGWQLSRLRLKSRRVPGAKRTRERLVSIEQVKALARAFSIRTFLWDEGDPPIKTSLLSLTSLMSLAEASDTLAPLGQKALATAKEWGWPLVELRSGCTIGPGEASWRDFVCGASQDELHRVLGVLR